MGLPPATRREVQNGFWMSPGVFPGSSLGFGLLGHTWLIVLSVGPLILRASLASVGG